MSPTQQRKPIYLLAGGRGSIRTRQDALLTRIISSAGVEEPSIAYIGAASFDDHNFFSMISGYLRASGAGRVTLAPLVGRRVKLEKTRDILESADMILVSGGDVEAGMEVIEERGILPFLRELFEGGKHFFGLSAGSIMLAEHWVYWDDPDDDGTAAMFPCMGLAPVLCDTHGEDEGWEELRALLRLAPEGSLGYGIPAGAALCVYPDGALEALGEAVHCLAKRGGSVARCANVPPREES